MSGGAGDGHDLLNALTALRLQAEVVAESLGDDSMAPVLRLVDRVEAAAAALLDRTSASPGTTSG